jgi:hypothetical protein
MMSDEVLSKPWLFWSSLCPSGIAAVGPLLSNSSVRFVKHGLAKAAVVMCLVASFDGGLFGSSLSSMSGNCSAVALDFPTCFGGHGMVDFARHCDLAGIAVLNN